MYYIQELQNFQPVTEAEQKDKQIILDYIQTFPDTILTRDNEFAHMTSSSMIFNEQGDKVLMIYHNIYNSWSWTGGHADGDEDFLEIAMKEAREETGLTKLQPLTVNTISVEVLPVWGHFKRGKYVSSHLHLNYSYALTASESLPLKIKADENSRVGWLPVTELDKYVTEPDMLPVYKRIIAKAAPYLR